MGSRVPRTRWEIVARSSNEEAIEPEQSVPLSVDATCEFERWGTPVTPACWLTIGGCSAPRSQKRAGKKPALRERLCWPILPRTRNAFAAPVAAQHSILSHTRPEGLVPRVRMGLHTGEPDTAAGEYVSLDCNSSWGTFGRRRLLDYRDVGECPASSVTGVS